LPGLIGGGAAAAVPQSMINSPPHNAVAVVLGDL